MKKSSRMEKVRNKLEANRFLKKRKNIIIFICLI